MTIAQMAAQIYSRHYVWHALEVLCDDFGSRFAGTEGERQCLDYLERQLKSWGLKVWREPFPYQCWQRGEATLEVTEPLFWRVPCISLPYCPPAEVEGELLLLEWGTPEEFEKYKEDIEGKLLLVSSETPPGYGRWIHRKEKYSRAVLAGAKAFLYANGTPGLGPQTGSLRSGREAPIPGISLSYENATRLKRLLQRHGQLKIRLRTTDKTFSSQTYNLFAELPGETDKVVLLGAHYDGHDIAQGAIDPASGTVTVLEAARVLAQLQLPRKHTLRFAFWGAEEIGLLGSHFHVQSLKDQLAHYLFVLNADSAGGMKVQGVQIHNWPELEEPFHHWLRELHHVGPVGQKMNAYSDHFPFTLQGVATAEIGNPQPTAGARGYTHTPLDTVDKVSRDGVLRAALLVTYLAHQLANQREEFFPRRSEEEVRTLLETDPHLEAYRTCRALEARET